MRLRVGHPHSKFLSILVYFVHYYSAFWGPRAISTIHEPRVCLCVCHQHSPFWRFWPISWTITQCFGVPEQFPRLTILGVRLRVRPQHSKFWPILTRFVDYYSPLWGPEAISIVVEPQDALTCWSSTLAVLADSSPFRGLLLAVLGSRSDFHD